MMRLIHFLYCFVLLICGLTINSNVQAQGGSLPVAFSGNIAGDPSSTRFFLDFDKNLSAQTFYMDQPNRIIIDLNESVFNLGGDNKLEPRGLISAVQFGRISKGRSRIVLTLNAPVEIIKASLKKRLNGDSYRLLLDMDSTDEQTYTNLLQQETLKLGANNVALVEEQESISQPRQKLRGSFRIVIDPGHGGIDGGAVGRGGLKEKQLVLKFANVVRKKLEEMGSFEVLMTREDDVFMSLKRRLEFSRQSKADLFISIHADSLKQTFVRGSTIYTLSKKASDRLSARLAESVNSADLVAGLAIEEEVASVTDILVDLTTRETKRFSKRFSAILTKNLGSQVRLIKNPQRSAAFGVLKAPEVPGVLLELGYLSNRDDEKLLQSKDWQEKAGSAVAQSVFDFFEPRLK